MKRHRTIILALGLLAPAGAYAADGGSGGSWSSHGSCRIVADGSLSCPSSFSPFQSQPAEARYPGEAYYWDRNHGDYAPRSGRRMENGDNRPNGGVRSLPTRSGK
ncbi:MAG: hypothetical protein JO256_05335 [Alphaproteobacteria bacterium]|nr:hypothetical protein [Alphaproteobacteria bacterium]